MPLKVLHENASAKLLAAMRVWIFGIWSCKLLVEPLHLLGELPTSVYSPVGLLMLTLQPVRDWMLLTTTLMAFKWITCLMCLVTMLGMSSRRWGDIACLLIFIHQSLIRGFGHVNHGELCLLFAAFFVAYFPSSDALALRINPLSKTRDPAYYATPMISMALILCLTYSLVAVRRICFGGMDIFLSDAFRYFAVLNIYGNTDFPWRAHALLENQWTSKVLAVGFPIVELFELMAPLCLVSRRFRSAFIAVLLPFHILSLVLMKIFFWENVLLFVLLVDWSRNSAASIVRGKATFKKATRTK